MAVRTKRLWPPTVVGLADVVLYTAAAGETVIIKTLSIVNNAALNNNISIRINGTTNANSIMRRNVASGVDGGDAQCFFVLQPGDTVHAQATQASAIVSGFGAELEGVAD